MPLSLWPREFGFFQYLRMRTFAVLLRFFVVITDPLMLRRERRLISPEIRHECVKIPSRDPGRSIAGDLYYPQNYSSSSRTPVLVSWHGSGFVIPALGYDTYICSRIARDAGVVVLDADYRKSPENPFPAAVLDVEDTLRWVATQAGLDAKRVAVSGYSAGGNLALVAATAIRKKLSHLLDIGLVVSVYPETDLSIPAEEKKVSTPIQPIPARVLQFFNDSYCPDDTLRTSPMVSPSFADPKDFPKRTEIIVAEGDILRPEADALVERLKEHGGRVSKHTLNGVRHGFDRGAKEGTLDWTRREELIDIYANLLKEAFGI